MKVEIVEEEVSRCGRKANEKHHTKTLQATGNEGALTDTKKRSKDIQGQPISVHTLSLAASRAHNHPARYWKS